MKFTATLLIIIASLTVTAQEGNVFLDRAFWKSNPTLQIVQQKVSDGYDATKLNQNAFDATVYALLEKAETPVIKYLLSLEGNPIEKRTHDSRTYIFWAAYAGNTEIMDYLLSKNAKTNITDSHGNTPVMFAASAGQIDPKVYDLFEKYGVKIFEEKTEKGANALHLIAGYAKDYKTIEYFVNKGISLQSKDAEGNGLFEYAAKGGNKNVLNMLIKRDVSFKNLNGKGGNAIIFASQGRRGHQNSLDFYKYLENLGVNVNTTNEDGRNPLHNIANNNEEKEVYNYFISKGVNVNKQDINGNSPFMIAANSNNLEIIKLLSSEIDNINLKNKNGQSALTKAVSGNTTETIAFLLKNGADINIVDVKGNSIAYYLLNSYKANDISTFESKLSLLKSNGLNFKMLQENDNSLLHLAAKYSDVSLLKQLGELNVPINAKNNEGLTALHIAAMTASNTDVLKYLLQKGADKTLTTEFDETVFDLASENELLQLQKSNLDFLN
ncbi:ankyrin repeat-containing protein [Patiriisocius marinistellae]|uniref:Ankyrin repeat-containing protein n=1 Tax=Patiriisocius marinistellae TaxID=2494560 RepID=A0A5J4FSK4_9FLAO|nr:ankyrin repeat domain-containing protein [Patiriisocius marinistellae]GEQ85127.1 ankyrin repeat-containing protein [Patiriisocius marinistellae]